jgi:cell division protein FtsZ
MFEIVNNYNQNAVIKVIGVGGGGGNAIISMLKSQIHGADFIIANTDVQALRDVNGATTVQIGSEITKGLGAGADPEKGKQAALEASETLKESIEGADMLFIAAGMGGGTGTGAAPVIAQIARDLGILTVAVVTKPFDFEGPERMSNAQEGINNLEQWVDSLIVIPNSKLKEVYGGSESIFSSFENANDVLRGAVKGITEIITIRGFMNVDFADVKTVMSGMGKAMMGSGVSSGENRAVDAVTTALSSPLLDNFDLQGASGVLVNITSGSDLTTDEFEIIGSKIREIANEDAKIITGCIKEDDNIGDLRVTIIATGFAQRNVTQQANLETSTEQNKNVNLGQSVNNNIAPNVDVAKKVNSIQPDEQTSIDIPAFLRQQAD